VVTIEALALVAVTPPPNTINIRLATEVNAEAHEGADNRDPSKAGGGAGGPIRPDKQVHVEESS
jgi:hypothetical protein